jgi:hypothetical protein
MLCRYTTNYQDFKAAQMLHIRSKRHGMLQYVIYNWCIPITGAIALLLLAYDIFINHFHYQPITGGILTALAWFGLWIPPMRIMNYRRLYKQMKNGRSDDYVLELEISGNELISRVPDISEGRFFRKAILAFLEDDKIALIYVAKNKFLLLPKHSLTPFQINTIHDWIAQRGAYAPTEPAPVEPAPTDAAH